MTCQPQNTQHSNSSKSVRFYPALDNRLLKEVVSVGPVSKDDWQRVHNNVNIAIKESRPEAFVTLRACRDRLLKTLQEAHSKDEMASLRASGTEEEYDERRQLLTEISNVEEERKAADAVKKDLKKSSILEEQGRSIRSAAMETMSSKRPGKEEMFEDSDIQPKTKARRSSSNFNSDFLKYLNEKLNFDKEKFELEKRERNERLEQDREFMTMMMNMINNQSHQNS